MKLFYRGTSYDYNPNQTRLSNTGRPVKSAQIAKAPYTLIYRGVTYRIDPNAVSEAESLPMSYQLTYRGTQYQVNRDHHGAVSIATRPVGTPTAKPWSAPSVFPRRYVAKVHQNNLLKNLQHRLQIAQERGDQKLIQMLEAERQQLLAGSN